MLKKQFFSGNDWCRTYKMTIVNNFRYAVLYRSNHVPFKSFANPKPIFVRFSFINIASSTVKHNVEFYIISINLCAKKDKIKVSIKNISWLTSNAIKSTIKTLDSKAICKILAMHAWPFVNEGRHSTSSAMNPFDAIKIVWCYFNLLRKICRQNMWIKYTMDLPFRHVCIFFRSSSVSHILISLMGILNGKYCSLWTEF